MAKVRLRCIVRCPELKSRYREKGLFWFAILLSACSSQNYYSCLLFIFFDLAISIKLFSFAIFNFAVLAMFEFLFTILTSWSFVPQFFCPSIETGHVKSLWKDNAHYWSYILLRKSSLLVLLIRTWTVRFLFPANPLHRYWWFCWRGFACEDQS